MMLQCACPGCVSGLVFAHNASVQLKESLQSTALVAGTCPRTPWHSARTTLPHLPTPTCPQVCAPRPPPGTLLLLGSHGPLAAHRARARQPGAPPTAAAAGCPAATHHRWCAGRPGGCPSSARGGGAPLWRVCAGHAAGGALQLCGRHHQGGRGWLSVPAWLRSESVLCIAVHDPMRACSVLIVQCRTFCSSLLQRVLFIHAREPMWVPEVRWSASLADLELVAARGPRLRCVGGLGRYMRASSTS